MLSCKKATELIEKKLLVKLSFKEKMQLEMHKSMCSACTTYEKQSKKLDEIFHIHFQHIDTAQPESTHEGLKKKIKDTLPEN